MSEAPRRRLEINPDLVRKFHDILEKEGFLKAMQRSFLSVDEAGFLKECLDGLNIEDLEMDWNKIYSLVAEKYNLFSAADMSGLDIENSDSARIIGWVRALIPAIPKKISSTSENQSSAIA